MCGVPYHAATGISRVWCGSATGAICEQIGDRPLEAGRATRRTRRHAGTLTEEALLDAAGDSRLAGICGGGGRFGIAWLELAGGRFCVEEVANEAALRTELARLKPTEILLPDDPTLAAVCAPLAFCRTRDTLEFDADLARATLTRHLGTHGLRPAAGARPDAGAAPPPRAVVREEPIGSRSSSLTA